MADGKNKIDDGSQDLLRTNGAYAVLQLVAQFDPQISFAKKLPNVVESVTKKFKIKHWQATGTNFLLRATDRNYLYHFDFQVFFCQTLGLDAWLNNVGEHSEALTIALNKMDVSRLINLSMKITLQLPLDMTHAEIVDLVLESYMPDTKEFKSDFGELDDIQLIFYGKQSGMKNQTVIAPQTGEQAKKTFLAIGNLEAFQEERFTDTSVSDHIKRISVDCLALILEISKENQPVAGLRSFFDDAFREAERIAGSTVSRIKGFNQPKGGSNGYPGKDK